VLFKRTATFLLLLCFLAQSFSRWLVVVDYCIDTAAYAKNCVNKDKPMMHCNGKCQMCKKMEQQDNPDKQTPERRSANDKNDPLSCDQDFSSGTSLIYMSATATRYAELSPGKTSRMPRSFFHPPDSRLIA
jgi:hypothetical protein